MVKPTLLLVKGKTLETSQLAGAAGTHCCSVARRGSKCFERHRVLLGSCHLGLLRSDFFANTLILQYKWICVAEYCGLLTSCMSCHSGTKCVAWCLLSLRSLAFFPAGLHILFPLERA